MKYNDSVRYWNPEERVWIMDNVKFDLIDLIDLNRILTGSFVLDRTEFKDASVKSAAPDRGGIKIVIPGSIIPPSRPSGPDDVYVA